MRRLLPLIALPVLLGSASPDTALRAPILAVHQIERTAVGVPGLVWSTRLEAGAVQWARHLARTGQLEHQIEVSMDTDSPGENLWMGTRGAWSPAEMVQAWVEEKRDFRPGVFPRVSRRGGYGAVGHYTQMVWRNTRAIGCGLATDGDMDYLVCRYDGPGNVMGERVF